MPDIPYQNQLYVKLVKKDQPLERMDYHNGFPNAITHNI